MDVMHHLQGHFNFSPQLLQAIHNYEQEWQLLTLRFVLGVQILYFWLHLAQTPLQAPKGIGIESGQDHARKEYQRI